jgi:hypothetical protein
MVRPVFLMVTFLVMFTSLASATDALGDRTSARGVDP